MQTHQALSVLRGAVRELSSSQPGTPTAGGGGLAEAAPSNAHLLLQISALHKAFLSLSEAFMEDLNGRQVEQEEHRQALQSVRRECVGRLQVRHPGLVLRTPKHHANKSQPSGQPTRLC